LEEHNVFATLAARNESGLLPVNETKQKGAQAADQDSREEAVVRVEKGNGAVVGRVGPVAGFVKQGKQPLVEAVG
jgi:hypothetical protein